MRTLYLLTLGTLMSLVMLFHTTAFAMGPEHTGSWYNKNESGHGFSIEYGDAGDGTPIVVVYWYVYDNDGSPVFLTGTGYPDSTGVDITFYAHYGMEFGDFDSVTHQERDGGVARFTFQDDKNGTFEYFPSTWTIQNFGHSQHQTPITKLFAVTHPYVEPPTGEPIPNPGSWSGRMTYDRNSAGGDACYDADVQLVVIVTGNKDYHYVNSITVTPASGGLKINDRLLHLVSTTGHVNGVFAGIDDEAITYTLALDTQGYGQGVWTYENSRCYGRWTFTKDQ